MKNQQPDDVLKRITSSDDSEDSLNSDNSLSKNEAKYKMPVDIDCVTETSFSPSVFDIYSSKHRSSQKSKQVRFKIGQISPESHQDYKYQEDQQSS